MSVCFSDSELGDWTGDCASLDEVSLPSPEPDQPCGVDVILLSTLPLDSYPLARHLVPMPRRIREQVLEVTKTVTLMEIVNSAPGKHPRSCEVTVTNIASDTGHPVSLKISHMHSAQNVDQNEAETQTPELLMTTDVSSNDGSLIIYSDARPRGRASSAEGFFTTVPNEPGLTKPSILSILAHIHHW
ncbi:unnamed protein product [Nippostrongylus brasiliensis]|uniref:E2F_CC-MB domain-containing protein n=1 Tax=Nippostrongylus brasiliensis TaxID=27835 RepID=A0A0N4YT63_NIPBR|nr:unnamed protein product [Nippostrongylus brasiliensis]